MPVRSEFATIVNLFEHAIGISETSLQCFGRRRRNFLNFIMLEPIFLSKNTISEGFSLSKARQNPNFFPAAKGGRVYNVKENHFSQCTFLLKRAFLLISRSPAIQGGGGRNSYPLSARALRSFFSQFSTSCFF